ncbi:MAG TPA: signal peptidase II [Ohtaekwangia sp.]|nr:signal peptidase II [Ohtaekwangia sp.]
MALRRMVRTLAILLVLTANVSCDQLSKRYVRNQVGTGETISFLDNHFIVTRVENTGAFLSLGNSLPRMWKTILLSIIPLSILIAAGLAVFRYHHIDKRTITGICFVLGGGIGNIFDRILYGSVTDFLYLDLILFRTGVFNMADVSIMTGLFIIIAATYCRPAPRLTGKQQPKH